MAALPPGISAAGINGGATGNYTPLTLGGVTFATQEAPSQFAIGSIEQLMAVTNLAGGGRVVHALGAQPKPVTFTGRFFADAVASQVPLLQSYAVDGKERPISWGREKYYCIVKEIVPGYRHAWFAEYSVTVEITRDANGVLTIATPLSVDTQIGALVTMGNNLLPEVASLDPEAPVTQFTTDLTNISVAVQNAGPIAQASQANIATLLAFIGTAKTNALAYETGLTSGSASYVPTQQYISALTLLALNTKNGQSQSAIQVQGSSLYEAAATYFGDVTQAFNLQSANGTLSPQLSRFTPTTVVLPPLPTAA